MRSRLFLAFFLLLIPALFAPHAHAQGTGESPIVVTSQQNQVEFPKYMRFAIQVQSTTPIQVLRLTVWQRGTALGSRHSPSFTPDVSVRGVYQWDFRGFGDGGYLPPGTHGEYTWHIEDAAGNTFDTPRQSYYVEDAAHKWNALADDKIRVSWHAGDQKFGQAIYDRALMAREYLANQLKLQNVDPLEIFIYADRQEFFNSLPAFSAEWTGGRMFPEYGVILINFGPENLEWGLRATSHELSHAILHSKIRGILGELALPHWLDEGLAVYNETDEHLPDDQFEDSYQNALRHNSLIPLRKMQDRFPDDSAQAGLAYGESYQAVKFMIEAYGESNFAELLNTYQSGARPDEGLVRVYGMNQDQLENAWRTKIGAPLRDVTTFGLPTLSAQPTFEFSSPLTNTSVPTQEATVEPTTVAVAATPASVDTADAKAPEFPVTSLCGGAFVFMGVVSYALLRRRKLSDELGRHT